MVQVYDQRSRNYLEAEEVDGQWPGPSPVIDFGPVEQPQESYQPLPPPLGWG